MCAQKTIPLNFNGQLKTVGNYSFFFGCFKLDAIIRVFYILRLLQQVIYLHAVAFRMWSIFIQWILLFLIDSLFAISTLTSV